MGTFHKGCNASDFFLNWFDKDKFSYSGKYVGEPMRSHISESTLHGRSQALFDMAAGTRTYSAPEYVDADKYRQAYQQERIDHAARPVLNQRHDL